MINLCHFTAFPFTLNLTAQLNVLLPSLPLYPVLREDRCQPTGFGDLPVSPGEWIGGVGGGHPEATQACQLLTFAALALVELEGEDDVFVVAAELANKALRLAQLGNEESNSERKILKNQAYN